MISIMADSAVPDHQGISRRELLRVGGLSLLGLTTADLDRLRAAAPRPQDRRRANACVFVFLFGGPSHIDLWDMKPAAPAEVRGEFRPAATRVPGLQLCEHLPLLAGQADKLCLLRSMTHHMPVHGPACSEMYTGREYFGPPVTDEARPEDWPSVAALVTRYAKSATRLPAAVVLPWHTQFVGQSKRIAGQTGGRMGERFNPVLLAGDPSGPEGETNNFRLRPELGAVRLSRRRSLLTGLEAARGPQTPASRTFAGHSETAYAMLQQPAFFQALDLRGVPARQRQRYGQSKFGQSLLLARRLVEAGIPLITVNWDDASKTDKVSPFWDTHHNNFPKLKGHLCPLFDRAFAAFLEGPARPRPAGEHAGRGDGGVRSHAAHRPVHPEQHDREDRPRPLAARLHGAAGGRRRAGRPGVRRHHQQRRFRGRQARDARRPGRHDPQPPGG